MPRASGGRNGMLSCGGVRQSVPEVSVHFRQRCFRFLARIRRPGSGRRRRQHEGRAGLPAAEPELGARPGRRVAPPGGALQQEVSAGGG